MAIHEITKEDKRTIEELMTTEKKENILEEANRIIHGARNEAYGSPLDDFSKTAKHWEAILGKKMLPGTNITAEEVALMMVCVKISRLGNTPTHRDSIVDIAGYAGTYEMVADERKRRQDVEEAVALGLIAEENHPGQGIKSEQISCSADGPPINGAHGFTVDMSTDKVVESSVPEVPVGSTFPLGNFMGGER